MSQLEAAHLVISLVMEPRNSKIKMRAIVHAILSKKTSSIVIVVTKMRIRLGKLFYMVWKEKTIIQELAKIPIKNMICS